MRRKLEWVVDIKESLNGDGKCHEDTATHSNVAEGVDEEGKEDCIDNTASTGVVNAPTDDKDCLIASQGEQKFVETVFKFGPRQHSECEDVSNDTNEAKDGDENSTKVVLVSLYNCHCQVCNILPTIQVYRGLVRDI